MWCNSSNGSFLFLLCVAIVQSAAFDRWSRPAWRLLFEVLDVCDLRAVALLRPAPCPVALDGDGELKQSTADVEDAAYLDTLRRREELGFTRRLFRPITTPQSLISA